MLHSRKDNIAVEEMAVKMKEEEHRQEMTVEIEMVETPMMAVEMPIMAVETPIMAAGEN